jgi:hypothetical protein
MKLLSIILLNYFLLISNEQDIDLIKNELIKSSDRNLEQYIPVLDKNIELDSENPVWYYLKGTLLNGINYKKGINIPNVNFSQTNASSEYFEKVLQLDSNYYTEIHLLDPYTSLTSIWGSQALAYDVKGNTDSVQTALKFGEERGAFNDASLGFCRNILNACAKDSYLFISGDNYTFSFYYLQNLEKVREDVIVIDLGLANAKWYTDYLVQKGKIGYNFEEYSIAESKVFKDTIQNTALLYNESFNWMIKKESKVLTNSNLLLKYIIENYASKEEVYFAPFFDKSYLMGIENHLVDHGVLLQLGKPVGQNISSSFYDKLTDSSFDFLENESYLNSRDAANLNDYYRYQFMRLIHSKINDKQPGIVVEYYKYYKEWVANKYFRSSSDQIDDYISRLTQICEQILNTVEN